MNARIEAEDEKGFGSVVAEVGVHIAVNTDENGDDGEQSGDANDHAENGEKRAGLILTEGRKGHLDVFAEIGVLCEFHG